MLVPDVKCTFFDGHLVFRCVFNVKPGLVSSEAGCRWHPARTVFRQQLGAVRGYRLQGVVSHVGGHCRSLGPWIGDSSPT